MKKLVFIIFILTSVCASAQQESLYGQYMFNKLVFNPAYAGSQEKLSIVLLNRNHWTDFEGSPKTTTLSVHTPLANKKVGLGFHAYNDQRGPLSTAGFMGSYAYRIPFFKGTLSMGLQLGLKYSHLTLKDIIADKNDPLLYDKSNEFLPDANIGVYYYTNMFYMGLSSTQMLGNTYSSSKDATGNTVYSKLARHYYFMAGIARYLSKDIVFKPSVMIKYVKDADPQIDLNASFLYKNLIWVGAAYRTEKTMSAYTKINITNNLTLGYSFDYTFNTSRVRESSHEIMLGYSFYFYKRRKVSPRFF